MAGTLTEIHVPTGTWHVDRLHSSIGFAVEHMGVSLFRGHFTDYDATLEVGPQGARLDGAARVESVDVADENLEAHLASPEFFDSQRTPDLRFASTDLRVDGEELVLAGELTIRSTPSPSRPRAPSATWPRTSRARSASASSCRRPSTAGASAWTGTPRWPAVASPWAPT
jgi:polyisoprenoid-binding protein YceI